LDTWITSFRPTWEDRLDTLEAYLRAVQSHGNRS
jgi:hypothetical protein